MWQQDSRRWEKEIAAYEAADRAQMPPKGGVVFVGSSTIRLWKTLAQDFPRHKTINRGFGGSMLPDATYYAERIIVPYAPRQVVLFAGTNDIAGKRSPRQVEVDFFGYVAKLRTVLPQTPLAFIEMTSSPSRWEQREAVVEANERIRRACDALEVAFIPVRTKLFGANGQPRPELFVADRLHLNLDGYRILASAVRPFLIRF